MSILQQSLVNIVFLSHEYTFGRTNAPGYFG